MEGTCRGDPAIRSANSGPIFTRRMFKVATSGEGAMKAKRALQPIQMGLGVPAGPETTTLIKLCLHRAGWLIGSEDAANGFNACTGQPIMGGMETRWPEGVSLLNKFYGHPAPALYVYTNDDGKDCVRVIESIEGVRMGCVAGSFAFDLAEHRFIFKHLQAKYPDCILHALTDDAIPAFKPPEDEKDEEAWEALYHRMAEFWNDYGQLANPMGLFRNLSKSKLLLPRGAPMPRSVPRAGGIILNGVYDGIIVAGLPVGTDEFIREHSASKVQTLNDKITKVESLREHDAHIAVRLLIEVVNSALNYSARGTPTPLLLEAAETMRCKVEGSQECCLEVAHGNRTTFSKERRERGLTLASLAVRDRMVPHTPVGNSGTSLPGHPDRGLAERHLPTGEAHAGN